MDASLKDALSLDVLLFENTSLDGECRRNS